MSRFWTPAELAVVRTRYPDEQAATIARDMGRPIGQVYQCAARLGLRKSDAFNASDRSGRVRHGKQNEAMRATQFKPGQVPANKGLRRPGWAPGRMAATQFKKGAMSGAAQHNYVPIGTERITRDGALERKVTDDPSLYPARRWNPVARIVWEAANGPVPPGHAVAFRAGRTTTNSARITLDAVELVSRAELMRRNSYLTRYPKEVADVIRLRGALNRKISNRSKRA
jgi:hypothetical protein